MNFRTTLFLLVLVVAVGVGIFIVSRHEDTSKTPDKIEERKLVDFDSADVTRVSIAGADDKHIVLEKAAGTWKMTSPVAARAKSMEVDDLVRALVTLKSREQLDASKKTSGGLDHPAFVVELTAKGKVTKLSFGDNSNVGDSLYVLVDDAAKPDITGNGIYATLDKPAGNYREMKLVNATSNDIKQLALTQKGKTIKLEKTGETWKMTEPAAIPAETSAVSDILSSISGLEATEFVDSPSAAAKNSLMHPRMTVSFSTATPSTAPATTAPATTEPTPLPGGQVIQFGGYQDITKKNMFASLDGADVAVVASTSEKSFEKTVLDLRNRDVLNVTPDRVSSFKVSINRPATTQPTTQPAEMREFTIERHKVEAPTLGPVLPNGVTVPTTLPTTATTQPAVATTQPSTQPAIATTQPAATQPDPTASAKWVFTSGVTGLAEEGQVTDLLAAMNPLRAEKYLEPAEVTGATYTVTIHVIPATAADQAEDYVLKLIDTGMRIDGYYKDLHFEVSRPFLEKVTGDFKTKKAPPAAPPSFPGAGGGSPFGG